MEEDRMNEEDRYISESRAFSRITFSQITPAVFSEILHKIRILEYAGSIKKTDIQQLSLNSDVTLWLEGHSWLTRDHYIRVLGYYCKCVGLGPSQLLDLKLSEDPKRRFYPAEILLETWIKMAKERQVTPSYIANVQNTVMSFYSLSRVRLKKVRTFVYKPNPKPNATIERVLKFRTGMNFYGQILNDFLISVPLRSGQFTQCKNCGQIFFPRWSNIETFPKIEPYSAFIIKPEKGHESERYANELAQVCYLTKSAAAGLNRLRDLKEEMLERPLRADEFIFTHQINLSGITHVTPITREGIRVINTTARKKTGEYINQHLYRSLANAILASRGIEKQLRDMYLGHTCSYDMNYILQLLPQWKKIFRDTGALEALDIVAQQKTPETPSSNFEFLKELSSEDLLFLREILRKAKSRGAVL
jgi:hypothetical protein